MKFNIFTKNEKIWDLEFILIRNKIFILRRSEAVSRDSCQLDIRWHLHDNVGWIEINKIEFGYLFLTLIYRHFACASCLKLDLYDFLIFPLIMGRRRTSDGDLSSFIYLKDRFGQRTVNILKKTNGVGRRTKAGQVRPTSSVLSNTVDVFRKMSCWWLPDARLSLRIVVLDRVVFRCYSQLFPFFEEMLPNKVLIST